MQSGANHFGLRLLASTWQLTHCCTPTTNRLNNTHMGWAGVGLGWVELSWGGVGFFKPYWNISQHQPLFLLFLFIYFCKTFSPKHFIQIKLIHHDINFYFIFLKHFLPKHFIQNQAYSSWYQFYFSRMEAQISSTNQRSTSLLHPCLHPFLLCCLGLVPTFSKGNLFWCQFTEENSELATSCTNRYSSGTILVSFSLSTLSTLAISTHVCRIIN